MVNRLPGEVSDRFISLRILLFLSCSPSALRGPALAELPGSTWKITNFRAGSAPRSWPKWSAMRRESNVDSGVTGFVGAGFGEDIRSMA